MDTRMLKQLQVLALIMSTVIAGRGQQKDSPGLTGASLGKVNELARRQKDISQFNSPGAKLEVIELSRNETSVGRVIQYALVAKNLPLDRKYRLSTMRIDQKVATEASLKSLDSTGKVMDGPGDPVTLLLMAAKGEPYHFLLASEDGRYKAFASVIPNPISASQKACFAEAILLLPDAEAVMVQGNGFPLNSDLIVEGNSEGERHDGKVKTDEEGKFSLTILPYKKNSKDGRTVLTVGSVDCKISLQFAWGKGTYHVE